MTREIGKIVNRLRKDKQMTLKDLSEKTNLSAGFLSQFERGKTTIAVDSLVTIAETLGTNIGYLIAEEGSSEDFIHRSYDNTLLYEEDSRYLNLKLTNKAKGMDFFPKMVVILPGKEGEGDEPFAHNGQEFLYVLEGVLTINMEGVYYDLYPGDTAHYCSNRTHMWENRTNKVVRILTVHSPNMLR